MVAEQAARRALPVEAQRGLRQAFAGEVAARLPHLRRPDDWETVRRDAHTLASSAWVVGEQEISLLARALEDQLEQGAEPAGLAPLVAALEAVQAQ